MDEKAKTPESLKEHSADYKNQSWQVYTIQELGNWVHLLVKRSYNRNNKDKRKKDLHDAQNYLNMMQSHLDYAISQCDAIVSFENEIESRRKEEEFQKAETKTGFIKYGETENK